MTVPDEMRRDEARWSSNLDVSERMRLAAAGIPPHGRALVWMWAMQQYDPTPTATMEDATVDESLLTLIAADACRAKPSLGAAYSTDDAAGTQLVARILAHGLTAANVPYTQPLVYLGLGVVVGTGALYDPSNVPHAAAIVRATLARLAPTARRVEVWLRHLSLHVEANLPRLAEHFTAESVFVETFAGRWLSTLFLFDLPVPVALRVWDSVLLEGTPDPVVRGALALLALHHDTLLDLDGPSQIRFLKDATGLLPTYEMQGLFVRYLAEHANDEAGSIV